MSVNQVASSPGLNTTGLIGRNIPEPDVTLNTAWVRNPSWPACEANAGDNKVVGLYAVWPGDGVGNGGNFFAMTISGAYTINYGDGTTTNYTSGASANYEYNYNNANLAGTDAPVTFTASTDTVNRTAHGYTNGMTVRFYNIVTTTGITQGTPYFVINATADTFQISASLNGSAIDLINNGSATLLPYKIAVVTITPQAGQNLTNISFNVRHSSTSVNYTTGWLDIAIAAPSCTSLSLGNSFAVVRYGYLERVRLNQLGAITSFNQLFYNFAELQSVTIADTITSVTSCSEMFLNCRSLLVAPFFNTASVTYMGLMFRACTSLDLVPLYNTSAVTSMAQMFYGCGAIKNVPLFNTSNVTDMNTMFRDCYSLQSVPLFDTGKVTNMSEMFRSVFGLKTVPLFNTASVTNMASMFYNALLESVPLFNTSNVTSMNSMFRGCAALRTVPLFDTGKVTDMGAMFRDSSIENPPLFNTALVTSMGEMFFGCVALSTIPQYNTASVTNMNSMLRSTPLQTVPPLNTAAVTNMAGMFQDSSFISSIPALNTSAVISSANFGSMFLNCSSIARIQAKNFNYTFSVASNKLSKTALEEIFTNLPTVATSQTITVTGNYGVDTPISRAGTLITGSKTVTVTDTTGLSNGMLVTGTGISGALTVAGDVTADTFTLAAHGLTNDTKVSFSAIGTLTGISTNTIYYIVNAATNTFQIALTVGGAAINLTGTNANATMNYPTYIASFVTNTSVTLTAPATGTGSQTLTYRLLDGALATLKNWAVTY